jgi:hypothetical protein
MRNEQPNERRKQKMWDLGEHLEEMRAGMRERKTERLQLRVTPSEKEEVDWVTDMLGVSTADYLMFLHEKAMKDFDKKLDMDERQRGDDSGSPGKRGRPRRGDGGEPYGDPIRRKPRRPRGRGGGAAKRV